MSPGGDWGSNRRPSDQWGKRLYHQVTAALFFTLICKDFTLSIFHPPKLEGPGIHSCVCHSEGVSLCDFGPRLNESESCFIFKYVYTYEESDLVFKLSYNTWK